MATLHSQFTNKTWTKENFMISTDSSLIQVADLNAFFKSNDMYWAKPIPEAEMSEMIQNSLCFAMYEQHAAGTAEGQQLIGFARCITDYTTILFLTDVYTKPEYRGKRLGSWLVTCIQETIESMPHLRRSMLITSDWERSVPFYQKLMGMNLMQGRQLKDGETGDNIAVMTRTGPGWPE